MRIVVIGIGNALRGDEGAGIQAALQLRVAAGGAPDVTVLDAGMFGFSLLPHLEGASALIAFDAARHGAPAGSICVREGSAFDDFVRRSGRGTHEVGLADLIYAARLAGWLPARRALIGIEPERVDWGLELTPAVAAALPRCIEVALDYIARWRKPAEDVPSLPRKVGHAAAA
jgi:hydrogenase maturation protease